MLQWILSLFLLYPFCKVIYRRIYPQDSGLFYEINHSATIKQTIYNTVKSVLRAHPHVPSFIELCDYYGLLQTSIGLMIRGIIRFFKPCTVYNRELVRLSDGGTVALDWGLSPSSASRTVTPGHKIAIILPGMLGDSASEYIYFLIPQLIKAGYSPVVYVARGNHHLQVTSDSLFPGKIADDLYEVIRFIRLKYCISSEKENPYKLYGVGFSLGGIGLLNYVSKMKEQSFLTATISVGPPYYGGQVAYSSGFLSDLFSGLIGIPLKMYFKKHYLSLIQANSEIGTFISYDTVLQTKTISQFNDKMYKMYYRSTLIDNYQREKSQKITFNNITNDNYKPIKASKRCNDVMEYYSDGNPGESVRDIATPTLVLAAKDDPVCPHENIPSGKNCEAYGENFIVVGILLYFLSIRLL